mgnify:CR=1 FL=1
MSRREEQLRKMRDQKISERVSNIYLSSITEVLFEAGVKKEDIETLLCNLTEKIENLTKGYIGLDTYIETVEEKINSNVKSDEKITVKLNAVKNIDGDDDNTVIFKNGNIYYNGVDSSNYDEDFYGAVYDLSSDYVQYVPAKRVWFPVPATMSAG